MLWHLGLPRPHWGAYLKPHPSVVAPLHQYPGYAHVLSPSRCRSGHRATQFLYLSLSIVGPHASSSSSHNISNHLKVNSCVVVPFSYSIQDTRSSLGWYGTALFSLPPSPPQLQTPSAIAVRLFACPPACLP